MDKNYTLGLISLMDLPVADIAVRPAPGGATQTLVRLPNQYGVSINQPATGIHLEIAVVYWKNDTDPINDWEWADEDSDNEHRNQQFMTLVDLQEILNGLVLLPDLR